MTKTIVAGLLVVILGCGEVGHAVRGRLVDPDGRALLELAIFVAETEEARREGLRLHGPLADGEGLLLLFPRSGPVCITNHGVPFPIDVVYLSETRHVIATERSIPADASGPYCQLDTRMALELPGGTLQPLNYAKLELF